MFLSCPVVSDSDREEVIWPKVTVDHGWMEAKLSPLARVVLF